MKMKKKPATATKKGAPTKKAAATKKTPPAKAAPRAESPRAAAPAPPPTKRSSTYTPSPVQGIGWAPFRYPPQ